MLRLIVPKNGVELQFLGREGSKPTSNQRAVVLCSLRTQFFSLQNFLRVSRNSYSALNSLIYRTQTQSACTSSTDPPVPFLANKTNGNTPRSANPKSEGKGQGIFWSKAFGIIDYCREFGFPSATCNIFCSKLILPSMNPQYCIHNQVPCNWLEVNYGSCDKQVPMA
jgi:hypothetical protein